MKKIFTLLNWLSKEKIQFKISLIENKNETFDYRIDTKHIVFRTFDEGHLVEIVNDHTIDMEDCSKFEIEDLPNILDKKYRWEFVPLTTDDFKKIDNDINGNPQWLLLSINKLGLNDDEIEKFIEEFDGYINENGYCFQTYNILFTVNQLNEKLTKYHSML